MQVVRAVLLILGIRLWNIWNSKAWQSKVSWEDWKTRVTESSWGVKCFGGAESKVGILIQSKAAMIQINMKNDTFSQAQTNEQISYLSSFSVLEPSQIFLPSDPAEMCPYPQHLHLSLFPPQLQGSAYRILPIIAPLIPYCFSGGQQ